ncbi:hypothetical protein [Streptomyces sp. S4.7]|uniref:hypothetical protein n=1 Tax=Streptomyces sp. S4.7 TaxID=2705439 RepID=UPI0013DC2A4B|nr:hypothetical protein [Streptomyces sp. S4.7]
MVAEHVAQFVRENVSLVVNGRAFLVIEEVGGRRLDPYATGRFDSVERAQRFQDDRFSAKGGYRLAQFARAEAMR